MSSLKLKQGVPSSLPHSNTTLLSFLAFSCPFPALNCPFKQSEKKKPVLYYKTVVEGVIGFYFFATVYRMSQYEKNIFCMKSFYGCVDGRTDARTNGRNAVLYNELSHKTRFQSVPIAALCLYNIQRENLVF